MLSTALFLALAANGSPVTTAAPEPAPVESATEDALEAYLGHDRYELSTLALRTDLPESWELALPVAGRVETARLRKRSLRGPEFRLVVDEGGGVLREVEPPPVSTYRGTIDGWPGAVVSLTLTPSGAKGVVWDQGSAWTVEPLRDVVPAAAPGVHVVAPVLTSPFDDGVCGTAHVAPAGAGQPGVQRSDDGSPTCLTVADLSYDCDYECYLQFGSDVNATLADIEAVSDGMVIPYETQTFITYRLGTVLVRTADPDPYVSTDSGVMLGEFQTEWNTNQAAVTRDMVHLATGKELDSNIIGLAFVGTVCPNGAEYGLTQWNISFGSRIAVVAHELGHNWSAPHCLDSTYCGIMCGGCTLTFGPITTAQILGYKRTRGCLDPAPPVVTSLFPSDTVPALLPGTAEMVGIVGDCFTSSSTVVVDGIDLDTVAETYTLQNPNFISFDPPQVSVLGPVELRVDDPNGSATTTLQVQAVAAPTHQAGDGEPANLLYTATGAPFVLAGQPGELHLLVYSQSNVPSVSSLVSLDLGNQFTDIGLAGVYTIGSAGWTGFTIPLSGVLFETFYSQTVRLTGGAPYADGNLQEVFVLF